MGKIVRNNWPLYSSKLNHKIFGFSWQAVQLPADVELAIDLYLQIHNMTTLDRG